MLEEKTTAFPRPLFAISIRWCVLSHAHHCRFHTCERSAVNELKIWSAFYPRHDSRPALTAPSPRPPSRHPPPSLISLLAMSSDTDQFDAVRVAVEKLATVLVNVLLVQALGYTMKVQGKLPDTALCVAASRSHDL
jgi:hypothetical protein